MPGDSDRSAGPEPNPAGKARRGTGRERKVSPDARGGPGRRRRARLFAAIGGGLWLAAVVVGLGIYVGTRPRKSRPEPQKEYAVKRAVQMADELKARERLGRAKQYVRERTGAAASA